MTAYELILDKLQEHGSTVRVMGAKAQAKCPAHDDKSPSLTITQQPDRARVRCWPGCDDLDVLAAIGLEVRHLFDEPRKPTQMGNLQRPRVYTPTAPRNRVQSALDYEGQPAQLRSDARQAHRATTHHRKRP